MLDSLLVERQAYFQQQRCMPKKKLGPVKFSSKKNTNTMEIITLQGEWNLTCVTFPFSTNNQIVNKNLKLERFLGFMGFSPWSCIENAVTIVLNIQPTIAFYSYVTQGWVLVAW